MLESFDALIGAIVALGGAITYVGRQLYNMAKSSTVFQTEVINRLERLEEWQQEHQNETDKYQDILKKVEKELAYLAGLRNAADNPRTIAE